jgi:putative flippase GtrA
MDLQSVIRPVAPEVDLAGPVLATVEIIIPVLNEERALPGCVRTLRRFLSRGFPFPATITIADNGSTDATWEIASALAEEHENVSALKLDVRGRGAAIKAAWCASLADIVVYMDVDLSTGLDALLPLVAPLASGHCEVAIGSRLTHNSRTQRSLKRELISRTYNGLVRYGFGLRCTDTQCGFKAARTEVIRPVLEAIEDNGWFFDTELLILAEHNGLRVHEVPIDWIEDMDSRVRIGKTATGNLKGLARITRTLAGDGARVEVPAIPELRPTHPDAVLSTPRAVTLAKFASFAAIGVVSTILYTALYLGLRTAISAVAANLCTLLIVGALNTEANRRWSFNRAVKPGLVMHSRAAILFIATYAFTTASVVVLHQIAPRAGSAMEILVLMASYGLMTMVRFIGLDRWVFSRRERKRSQNARS